LDQYPDSGIIWKALGTSLQLQGKDGLSAIEKAAKLLPDDAETHYNLGIALKTLGRFDEAVTSFRRALMIKPDYFKAHCNLGESLRRLGRFDAAIASHCRALEIKPDYAEAHNNLGIVLKDLRRLNEAVASYCRALEINPDVAEVWFNLGNALKELGKFDDAIASYYRALAIKPEYEEAHCNLGDLLRELGKTDEAIKCFNNALLLAPESVNAHAGMARIDINLGQFEEAQVKISRGLEIQPDSPALLSTIPLLRKMTLADTEWLNKVLDLSAPDNSVLSEQEAISVQFGICKYYDDTKQYDLAFAAARQGNMLKRKRTGAFDRAGFSQLVDTVIATYTADVTNQRRDGASLSQRPVLVVGMPRSGTSLIEQIIASHPEATGAGELYFWNEHANANLAVIKSAKYEPALLAKIATAYEQLLQHYSAESIRVVDKMPQNFIWLGLITAVFPQARIIHSMRNPVDTCLSIHLHNFNLSHTYATDLDDLAFYYREYLRLMQHWRTVLPADRFLEVPYEALIDDQSAWSQRMIEFVGLAWDERCLDFHKTERSVGTSSNWQVRQKIYTTSKARWRNYEKHLGPLLADDLVAGF